MKNLTNQQAKEFWRNFREEQRQKSAATIDVCLKLCSVHKKIFDEKVEVQQQVDRRVPTTQIDLRIRKDFPPTRLNTAIFDEEILLKFRNENQDSHKLKILPKKASGIRCPSVSSVDSENRRLNKVYDKWPNYDEISEIVGFRIEPKAKKTLPKENSSRTGRNRSLSRQIKSSLVFKQIGVNKKKKTTKIDLPIVEQEDEKAKIIVAPVEPKKDIVVRLPTSLCPSSLSFSQRLETRRWILKTDFRAPSTRTIPVF